MDGQRENSDGSGEDWQWRAPGQETWKLEDDGGGQTAQRMETGQTAVMPLGCFRQARLRSRAVDDGQRQTDTDASDRLVGVKSQSNRADSPPTGSSMERGSAAR